jgi:steroid delta-isomerase-like uncharacterized protein
MAMDIKKLIDDYVSAVNAHDVNKAGSFWADDGIYENWGQEIVKRGKKELADFLNTSFAELPGIKMEVKSVFQAGDWVGMERVDSGTFAHSHIPAMPATGKIFSIRIASIIQLHKGKIIRQSDYYNAVTFMQQVGLMPAQPK